VSTMKRRLPDPLGRIEEQSLEVLKSSPERRPSERSSPPRN
jgi:hypothetical protein